MLIGITVNASNYEYSIDISDNFSSVKNGEDLTAVSQKLNMSTDELNAYFNKNGLIYLAVSDDAKSQIKISEFTDNFSSAVNDMSELDETALNEFRSAIDNNNSGNAKVVLNNDRKFISVKSTRIDSGGTYTVTQYITICNSKTIYFAGYNEGTDTSGEILSAFESFQIQEIPVATRSFAVPTVFIFVGIVVFLAIAIIMIIGILKTFIKKHREVFDD